MKGKTIIPALLFITICTLKVLAGDNEDAVKQAVKNYYYLYFVKMDTSEYRSILTKDYLLLENGEIFGTEGDIAAMPDKDSGYERTDSFDFRLVKIEGGIAYTVYFLKSKITDKVNGTHNKEWLESAILRRSGEGWKIALLHSTRITKPEE
jgi:Domain of unknown function (DUF4440)